MKTRKNIQRKHKKIEKKTKLAKKYRITSKEVKKRKRDGAVCNQSIDKFFATKNDFTRAEKVSKLLNEKLKNLKKQVHNAKCGSGYNND